ncbi:MAG: Dabb family protein [Pseudomonadota bacterium]
MQLRASLYKESEDATGTHDLAAAKAETSPEKLDGLLQDLKALAGQVPGIISISAGRNLTDRAAGCTHAAIVTLENLAALQPYLEHPRHQTVGGGLREAAELLVFDYEY